MESSPFCSEIESYVKSLTIKMRAEKKSSSTISNYNSTYVKFIAFCKAYHKKITFNNLKEDDIYAYIQYRTDIAEIHGDLSNSTINGIIVHLKKLFSHIERNSDELLDFKKVFEDISIKKSIKTPKGLSNADVDNLLLHLKKIYDPKKLIIIRNTILLKLMLFGGLRASESLTIKVSDFKEHKQFYKITFRGKGDKKRVTYVLKSDFEYLLEDIKKIETFDIGKVIALTSSKKSMDRFGLSKAVNSIYKKAGIKSTGLHILRHTAAKRLIADNVSIVAVQSLLGHSSIQTTTIYVDPTEDMIINELSK